MDKAENHLIRQLMVAQGMVTPEQADECLRRIERGEAGGDYPGLLLSMGYLSSEDHAILRRIFSPAPPTPAPPPPPPPPASRDDSTLEKVITATGILPLEYLAAAKRSLEAVDASRRPPLHEFLLEQGYLTKLQVQGLVKNLDAPEYACEGCGKPYARGPGEPPSRCPSCGIALPQPGIPVSLELPVGGKPVPPVGTLTILLGTNRGFVYEVGEGARVTLGRRASHKIRLFGGQVSRDHCEIVPQGEGLLLQDMESSFGTFVNGRTAAGHALSDGDLIKVGHTVLEFRAAPRTEARRPGDEDVDEILFGKIAVKLALASQRQVDEAVALQETTHKGRLIGKILVERGVLDQGGLLRILQVQRRNLRVRGYYSDETTEKALFGRIAVREGLATEAQLNDALRTQAKAESLSGIRLKIGEILVRKGAMNVDGVQRVLSIQGRGELALPLPGYEILTKLGEGGMGAVFRARQRSLDRDVAVKVLSPRLSRDPAYIERFLREARAAAALSHENIIRAIDVGQAGDHYYFVMEFIEGPTALDLAQRKGPLPEREVVDIGIQVARALDHAWAHGIVHRDVKPENIMITRDGVAKLCDLGLARYPAAQGGRDSEEAVGTPNYVSPEQARGDPGADVRTDIYSLGATLYHLATGQMPFKKLGPPLVVMARHLTEQIPNPRAVNPALSEGTCRVLRKMMAKDPAKRYANPRELLDELALVLAGQAPRNADIGSAVSTIAPA